MSLSTSTPGCRPGTAARTGRVGRYRAWLSSSPTTASSATLPASPSSRLSTIRREYGGNQVAILNRLLATLKENQVPGPQFFRLKQEFSAILGEGGQGNVRGINEPSAKRYRKAGRRVLTKWPVEAIAIKQYQRSKMVRNGPDTHNLGSRFIAAECELLALSPSLFREHPNIVQLVGWGLCLDTLEDPESSCCASIQVPLLVLERAEMNFRQLLRLLFPRKAKPPEARAEEGLARGTLSGSTLNVPLLGSSEAESSNRRLMGQWSGFATDPYDIVRLLCIDIGHGLQILHEHKFTHGDLKPENVLAFKTDKGWVAKLCDFGCARGQAEETVNKDGVAQRPAPQRDQYLGTPSWLPPKGEAAQDHDYEGLQKCDLYVYGLVVWSAFCLRGDPPPQNPRLEDALEDVQQLIRPGVYLRFPFRSRKLWYCNRVKQVLETTMIDRHLREMKPWKHLYRDRERNVQATGVTPETLNSSHRNPDLSTNSVPKTVISESLAQTSLTLSVKANYNNNEWWSAAKTNRDADADTGSPRDYITIPTEASNATASTFLQEEGSGPASSIALASDDNCIETMLFESRRRKTEALQIPKDMIKTLISWDKGASNSGDLYYYARFRSRIRPEWWSLGSTVNILNEALKIHPVVDICTLAWLCNGPIGQKEVKALPANVETWNIILDPNYLNESERLDRFLLLLQFGARVEKHIFGTRCSIFLTYIRSCRLEIIPTVLAEVCRRFEEVKDTKHISPDTRAYLTGNARYVRGSMGSQITSAALDLEAGQDGDAISDMWRYILVDSRYDLLRGAATKRRKPIHAWNEHTPLFNSDLLPIGWKQIQGPDNLQRTPVFEEALTQSITLTSPKFSLMRMRQVKVGFLHLDKKHMCHLDLISCIQYDIGKLDQNDFNKDISDRFPSYNGDWFAKDWATESNEKDVLSMLRDPLRIRTYAIRVQRFRISISHFILGAASLIFEIGTPLFGIIETIFLVLVVGFFTFLHFVNFFLPHALKFSYERIWSSFCAVLPEQLGDRWERMFIGE